MKLGLLHSIALTFTVAALAGTLRAEVKLANEYKTGGFAIGAQAYSFKQFTLFEAIEKNADAGGKILELSTKQNVSKDDPTVFNHEASDELIAKVKAKLAQHHMVAVAYGVIPIPTDESKARKIFVFAKKMGLRALTTESTESIDTIEKLVKEFDIPVGYHNHARRPEKANYKVWDPNYVLSLVKNRDPRIGAAPETGHWLRSNVDPVEGLRLLKGRIVSVHLKDLNEKGTMTAHDVPYGTGVGKVKACLDELKSQGFDGTIAIEYEYNWDDNAPEIKQCIDFVRSYGK